MSVLASSLTSSVSGLRPLDERCDLFAVADLIELCFAESMDAEGRRYVRDLRLSARTAGFWQFMGAFSEQDSRRIFNASSGYVWIEDERLVGNLSLFPFQTHGHPCYLIANVAVHPDFRGRGIGRALTAAGINFARSHKAHAIWLQVRENNPPAVHIYQALGFQERARRTTYQVRGDPNRGQPGALPGWTIQPRTSAQWPLQRDWLRRLYPRELSWHLPIDWKSLEPGIRGSLYRWMNLIFPRQWVVHGNQGLQGVLTCYHTVGHTDTLWLALPEAVDESAVRELLAHFRRHNTKDRPARLNLPSGCASQALLEAGCEARHTLIWMEYPLT